jgi:hypothetical protein
VPGPSLRVTPETEERARLQRGRLLVATLAAARLEWETEPRSVLALRQWPTRVMRSGTSPLVGHAMETRAGAPHSNQLAGLTQ